MYDLRSKISFALVSVFLQSFLLYVLTFGFIASLLFFPVYVTLGVVIAIAYVRFRRYLTVRRFCLSLYDTLSLIQQSSLPKGFRRVATTKREDETDEEDD